MTALVACIGGCHIDVTALIAGEVVLGSSNPASVTRQPGGVATNVARTLASLGVDVVLAGLVGDDDDGRVLRSTLQAEGIGIEGLASGDGPTATYTAVVDGDGGLVLGIADMGAYGGMNEGWVERTLRAIAAADIWVVDANLPAAAIGALLAERGGRSVLANPVSVAKASRMADHLDGFEVVFPDRGELARLAGDEGSPGDQVRRLSRRCGVVATLGASGILTALRDSHVTSVPPCPPDQVVDPTGAGDALLGGYVAGVVLGEDPLALGLAAASLAVEVRGAVPDGLDLAAVRRRAARCA